MHVAIKKRILSQYLLVCCFLFVDHAMALPLPVSQVSGLLLLEGQYGEAPEKVHWAQSVWGDTAAAV